MNSLGTYKVARGRRTKSGLAEGSAPVAHAPESSLTPVARSADMGSRVYVPFPFAFAVGLGGAVPDVPKIPGCRGGALTVFSVDR